MDVTVKKRYIDSIKERLMNFPEVEKIIIFGSFLRSEEPHDIDVAIVQNSKNEYLDLSLKYRKALRDIARKIPIDILPLKKDYRSFFAEEIEKGTIIYER